MEGQASEENSRQVITRSIKGLEHAEWRGGVRVG